MNLMKIDKNEDQFAIFSKQHNAHYITAYKIFLDNKFLGVGVKNFRNFVMIQNIQKKIWMLFSSS